MKYLPALLGPFMLVWTVSCAPHPYTVCRGEDYCTPPLTHDEAIQAAQRIGCLDIAPERLGLLDRRLEDR